MSKEIDYWGVRLNYLILSVLRRMWKDTAGDDLIKWIIHGK